MTRPNEQENQNTLLSWLTGLPAIYAIGIAAGIFVWQSGMLQKAKDKIFSKKESE